jgi:hypothetical protein
MHTSTTSAGVLLILCLVAITSKILLIRGASRHRELPRPLRMLLITRATLFVLIIAVCLYGFLPSRWRLPTISMNFLFALIAIWILLLVPFFVLSWKQRKPRSPKQAGASAP